MRARNTPLLAFPCTQPPTPCLCNTLRAPQPLLEQQVIKSQGEVDDLYEPITPDDLVRKEWTEKAKCPDEVMATLLPYQAEG